MLLQDHVTSAERHAHFLPPRSSFSAPRAVLFGPRAMFLGRAASFASWACGSTSSSFVFGRWTDIGSRDFCPGHGLTECQGHVERCTQPVPRAKAGAAHLRRQCHCTHEFPCVVPYPCILAPCIPLRRSVSTVHSLASFRFLAFPCTGLK